MTKIMFKNGINILIGILMGILLHYFLYRFSIPAKSFIYVAF
jgi:hypothetical protein